MLDAVVSALFANDGAALVMTPIATSIISRSSIDERSKIVFMMGIGFVADTASLPFIISNLVNIIDATYFDISFLLYAEYMIFPFIISVITSVILYYFLLVRKTDKNQELPSFQPTINDQLLVKLGFPFIAILVLAYFLTSFAKIPVAMVAIPAATLLGIIAKRRKK